MLEAFMGDIGDPYLITTLFTGLVLGAVCFGLSVLPRWEDQERMRASKPTPTVELRKAA
jgi:hypothetical protein